MYQEIPSKTNQVQLLNLGLKYDGANEQKHFLIFWLWQIHLMRTNMISFLTNTDFTVVIVSIFCSTDRLMTMLCNIEILSEKSDLSAEPDID